MVWIYDIWFQKFPRLDEMTTQQTPVSSAHLAADDSQVRSRKQLQHMATIDLGSLHLEHEDHYMMNRSRSQEEPYPSLKLVQKKENWYKTSPKEKRKKTSKLGMRKSQSMDFDDPYEVDDVEPRVLKLTSKTDVREFPQIRAFESRDIDVSDIYVKVPIQTWLALLLA